MAQNKVVVKFLNGTVLKGHTMDFSPNKDTFHLAVSPDQPPQAISVAGCKAIFFVKDYQGNKTRKDEYDFEKARTMGKKAEVIFQDGEKILGFFQFFHPGNLVNFLLPADTGNNNQRVAIIKGTYKEVKFL